MHFNIAVGYKKHFSWHFNFAVFRDRPQNHKIKMLGKFHAIKYFQNFIIAVRLIQLFQNFILKAGLKQLFSEFHCRSAINLIISEFHYRI